jgi:hypothetical protein
MEGLYNAMGNNPISNVDVLGDITHYYNSEGTLLRSLDDGNKNVTISIIKDSELKAFEAKSAGLDYTQKSLKDSRYAISDKLKAQLLSGFGVKYDMKEIADYYDKHSKDFYKGDFYKPTDGKGKLVSEHMAGMKLVDGFLRIMDNKGKDDYKFNCPVNSMSTENGDADIHTHTSEGRRMTEGGRGLSVDYGKAAFGSFEPLTLEGDLSRRSWEGKNGSSYKYKMGIFDVVVSPTHVYLYRTGQVVVAIDRKGVPSKNPGEIK